MIDGARPPLGDREAPTEEQASTSRWRKLRKAVLGLTTGTVLAVCAILSMVVLADYLLNTGKVYRGVEVAGVSPGGKTPEEAEKHLQSHLADDSLQEVRLTGPGRSLSLTREDLGIIMEAEGTAGRAYSVGRRGWVGERLKERAEALFGTVEVEPEVGYRPKVARGMVEDLAHELERDPRDAEVSIEGEEVRMQGAADSYEVDREATLKGLRRSIGDLSGEAPVVGSVVEPEVSTAAAEQASEKARSALEQPLVFEHRERRWVLQPARVGEILKITNDGTRIEVGVDGNQLRNVLRGMYSALASRSHDAEFVPAGASLAIEPHRNGLRIDQERLVEELNSGLFRGRYAYQVPIAAIEPELTTEHAESIKPTELLGEYETNYLSYDDTQGRVTNLETASQAVNHTLLAPGEVFSFNDLAAPLEYESAKVIVDGRVDAADGGGLCQVSSTLYMAANHAGLGIVERHAHFAELAYIRPGLDATVWFGTGGGDELDMKFENTTGSHLLLRQWVADDGYVKAEIWGQPTSKEVSINSRMVSSGPGSTIWVAARTVTQNGRVVENGVLNRDTYQPLG